jgi:DNA-binding NarL/FixJ family response regulator
MKPTKVLIVDDSQIFLEGVKLILRNNNLFQIIGEANNAAEALARIKENVPDIILLDISLEKEMDGITLAQTIKQDYPNIKIIFLTEHKGIEFLINALKTGAYAYLPKDTNQAELLHVLTSVNESKCVYLGETLPLTTLLETFGSQENISKNKIQDLTSREIEIIDLLAKGFSSKEISTILTIETNTIESHKERIKEKLNLKTVVQIVVFAIKRGIIA